MISQKAKYALRALVALAEAPQGSCLLIADIAERQKIPKKFLEQILLELKSLGYVDSRRGKQGGYLLVRSPRDISFSQILRAIDGPLALLPCLSIVAYRPCLDCCAEDQCVIRPVFARVAETTRAILDQTTIADVVQGGGRDLLS